MASTANANSTNPTNPSPDKNSDGEWTTIPIKPRPLVSFPSRPGDATLHMIVLCSYFAKSTGKWIWNCYLDDENLSLNPSRAERSVRIEKAFVKSGHFFAERGIVLYSLNISTSRLVELFFGSEEDLWKADALVEQYSQAMTGGADCIRRQEHTGKMVCHGVQIPKERTGKFVGRYNLEEERLRELEDMNPVFHLDGRRWIYRIRCVHYMSSRTSLEQLANTGETWAITFSDFRAAECFVDGEAEFNFFVGPCAGGVKWYKEHPFKTFRKPTDFQRTPGSNNSGSVSGVVESSNPTAAGANKRVQDRIEDLVPSESSEQAKSTQDVRVCIAEQKKPDYQALASLIKQAASRAGAKLTSTEQHKTGSQPTTTAATGGSSQAVVAGKPEVQMLNTPASDGLKQAVIAKKPKAQVPTTGFTNNAKGAALVKTNTTEQGKPQPLQYLAKTTPASMLEQDPKSQVPPPSRGPVATGAPQDTIEKPFPLGPSSPPTEGVERQNLKRAFAKKGAKITPQSKEPTSGDNNSTPAAPTQTTTSTRATQSSCQRHHPRQKASDNIAATTTTTAASTTGVSAGRGETTNATLGDKSPLRVEETTSLEATGKHKQKNGRWGKKKKADKKPPATGTTGGEGQGGEKVEAGVAKGVVSR